MCGLVGLLGKLEYKDEAVMQRLLVLDWWRGKDSTGFAALRTSGDVKIAKVTSHPFDLFDTGKFKDACSGHNSSVFLGHNRAATKGVVNWENAHPYQYGHIVGAHNGTLWATCHNRLEEAVGEKFPVDSMAIFAAIAKIGIEKTVAMLDGAYALTYVNLKDNTFNVIRNKERPLWYGYSKDGTVMWYASEWPMMRAAISHGGDSYRDVFYNEGNFCWFGFDEDIHYSYDLDELRKGGKRPKPTVKKMEGKKSFLAPSASGGHRTGFNDPFKRESPYESAIASIHTGGNSNGFSPTPHSGQTTTPTTSRGTQSVPALICLPGTKDDPTAGRISKEKFEALAERGCSFCGDEIKWGDKGVAIYERDGTILCNLHSPPGVKNDDIRIFMPKVTA